MRVTATVRTTGRTGVEMEALTAAATAALTLYDMVKGVQRDVRVEDLRLLAKRGGRSGDYRAPGGVLGERESGCGCGRCSPSATGWPPGSATTPAAAPCASCLRPPGPAGLAGGGGRRARAGRGRPAGHDRRRRRGPDHRRHRPRPPRRHPEATRAVLDREAPGIAEALRHASLAITPFAMLSRATAGLVGRVLVVNLPGNPKAVREEWSVLAPSSPRPSEPPRAPCRREPPLPPGH